MHILSIACVIFVNRKYLYFMSHSLKKTNDCKCTDVPPKDISPVEIIQRA